MRIRKKKWAEPELSVCDFYVAEPEKLRGNWKSFFKNDKPIMLEVGFDMLGVGRRNIVSLFEGTDREIDNIALVRYNVDMLDKIIAPEDRISRIYINFCNPWPRPKHNKRRLTHPRKLRLYRELLTGGDEVHFKTDDDGLFEDTLEYLKEENYTVLTLSYDLHNSSIDADLTPMTEHERMFSEEGIKIKYLVATKG